MCRRRAIRLRVAAFVLAVRWPLTTVPESIQSYAKFHRATAWRAFASMVISTLRRPSLFTIQNTGRVEEVSTIRVSGWIRGSLESVGRFIPFAYANDTDCVGWARAWLICVVIEKMRHSKP